MKPIKTKYGPKIQKYLGRGEAYTLRRMIGSPAIVGFRPGTMVELVRTPSDPGEIMSLSLFPELSKELLSCGSKTVRSIRTNHYFRIEDEECLRKDKHSIGPLLEETYWSVNGWLQFTNVSYRREILPVGTTGMVIKLVNVSPDERFYGSEAVSYRYPPNFYIVFVTPILDIVRSGMWLWPVQETNALSPGTKGGFENFHFGPKQEN